MYKLSYNSVIRLADGASIPLVNENRDYEEYKQWLAAGNIPETQYTPAELLQQIEDAKPKVVSMGQARAALIQSGMFDTVNNAILSSTDLQLKSDWEYRIEVRRDWPALTTISTSLGLTSTQLDDLFLLASTL